MFSVFHQESHSQQAEQSLVVVHLLVGAYEHEFFEQYELFESTFS